MAGREYAVLGPLQSASVSSGFLGCELDGGLPRSDRPVAIVWLPDELSTDNRHLTRLLRETAFVGRLDHPGILRVHGLEHFEEGWARITEFAEGDPLSFVLERADETPEGAVVAPEIAARIVIDLAAAVHFAHETGAASPSGRPVVHGGIRPSTVLIGYDGRVVLGGFGASLLAPATAHGYDRRSWARFMAPEQIIGGKATMSVATDVYALGALLHSMLSGAPPFEDAEDIDTAVMTTPPLTIKGDGLSALLGEVAATAMAKRGGDRPSSAGALIELIEAALEVEHRTAASTADVAHWLDTLVPPDDSVRSTRRQLLKSAEDPEGVTPLVTIGEVPDGIDHEVFAAARPGVKAIAWLGRGTSVASVAATPTAEVGSEGNGPPEAAPPTQALGEGPMVSAEPSPEPEEPLPTRANASAVDRPNPSARADSDRTRKPASGDHSTGEAASQASSLEEESDHEEELAKAPADAFALGAEPAAADDEGAAQPLGQAPVLEAEPQPTPRPGVQEPAPNADPDPGPAAVRWSDAAATDEPSTPSYTPSPPDPSVMYAPAPEAAVSPAPFPRAPTAPPAAPSERALVPLVRLESDISELLPSPSPLAPNPTIQTTRPPSVRPPADHAQEAWEFPIDEASEIGVAPGGGPAPLAASTGRPTLSPGAARPETSATRGDSMPVSLLAPPPVRRRQHPSMLRPEWDHPSRNTPTESRSFLEAAQLEARADEARVAAMTHQPARALSSHVRPLDVHGDDAQITQFNMRAGDGSRSVLYLILAAAFGLLIFLIVAPGPPPEAPQGENERVLVDRALVKQVLAEAEEDRAVKTQHLEMPERGTSTMLAVSKTEPLPPPPTPAPEPTTTGRLIVQTEPPLDVFIDDEHMGRSPLDRALAVGSYTIRLTDRRTGINTYRKVDIAADIPARIRKTFGTSLLEVSAPRGARIHINGRFLGKAPMEKAATIYEGRYLLKVTYQGMSWTERFTATPGRKISFEVRIRDP